MKRQHVSPEEQLRDLREELRASTMMLQAYQASLHKMCSAAQALSVQLEALVDSADANDWEAVNVQLRQLSENRKAARARKPRVH